MAATRFLPDSFTLALVGTVTLASLLPPRGDASHAFETLTTCAVGLLFFLHGARLSRAAIVAGFMHWRLHALVLASSFVLFPLLGLVLKPLLSQLVTPALYTGVLYLCVLPATVQSSIAFTSMARGNVPAAVCSASASTLLGVFVTPLLVGLVVTPQATGAGGALDAVLRILLQLMLPFVAGHLLRPWIGTWLQARARALKSVDQGSILLVVYTAFGAAVVEGLWHQVSALQLAGLVGVCGVLLAAALGVTAGLARLFGFERADEIAIVFCGSKKSLASGVPMAKILFDPASVGVVVLPLMLFHQIQLMVCAMLARRWARREAPSDAVGEAVHP